MKHFADPHPRGNFLIVVAADAKVMLFLPEEHVGISNRQRLSRRNRTLRQRGVSLEVAAARCTRSIELKQETVAATGFGCLVSQLLASEKHRIFEVILKNK